MDNMTGPNIKFLRRSRGWDQKKLAEKLGVSRSIISKYESGQTSLDSDKLFLIRKIFGVDIDNLMIMDFEKDGIPPPSNKEEVIDPRILKHLLDKIDRLESNDNITAEQISNALDVAKEKHPELGKEFDKGLK